jgi:drug/metabolite transporter (DMT)-like permease
MNVIAMSESPQQTNQAEARFFVAPWAVAACLFILEVSGMRETLQSMLPDAVRGVPWDNVWWGMAGFCGICSFCWAYAYERRIGRRGVRMVVWTGISGIGMFLLHLSILLVIFSWGVGKPGL